MWELDYKESWAPKNWCFWTVVLEKTLESPLDCKEIQPVHPKGDHSWIFIGMTDAEAETPILWPPDAKNWFIGKDPDAGKDWRWEKGTRGWDGWMASLTQWVWVWANSGSWWWTGKPGVLQSTGSQRVGHNSVTELNWSERISKLCLCYNVHVCTVCIYWIYMSTLYRSLLWARELGLKSVHTLIWKYFIAKKFWSSSEPSVNCNDSIKSHRS